MNGCANCSEAVQGVGEGFWSGVGNWFSSGIGADLLKAGISFGVGYGLHELTGGRSGGGGTTGNLTGGTTVNPSGSGFIPQAGAGSQPIVLQQAATPTPSWVLPVAVVGGLAALLLALKK